MCEERSRKSKKNIPKIAKQNYATFEILIVDDNSSDNTAQVVAELKSYILIYNT
ncbi:MAG: glycosyltransferase [Sphingobacteriales bacterium]|nr:MAG: glycosyltransferase [Sphingobacteriales bacterium]